MSTEQRECENLYPERQSTADTAADARDSETATGERVPPNSVLSPVLGATQAPPCRRVDDQLVLFLRLLADRVERRELSRSQLLRTSEFFMSYLFHNELDKNMPQGEGDERGNAGSSSDFQKFMSLGWYVYTFLLPHDGSENGAAEETE